MKVNFKRVFNSNPYTQLTSEGFPVLGQLADKGPSDDSLSRSMRSTQEESAKVGNSESVAELDLGKAGQQILFAFCQHLCHTSQSCRSVSDMSDSPKS